MSERSSRTFNVKRNIGYATLQLASTIVLPFVVRTILIYRFGADYLGLDSLFTSVLKVLSIAELGFSTAVVYSMYRPVAEGDTESVCAYLSYFKKIYRVIGLAIFAIGMLLVPVLPQLVHDAELPGGLDLYVCYFIFLGDSVVSYLLFGYMTAVPAAYQRMDVLSRVEIVANMLKCVAQSMLLLASDNFYLYLIAMPVVTVIRNLIAYRAVGKRYPDITCRGTLSIEQKRELNKKVAGLFINKLNTTSRNSIDSLCISAFIGLAATGIYNNYYFVIKALMAVSTVIYSSMLPSVGNSIAVETPDKNYRDMRRFDFIYTAAAGWMTACLLCMYQPFMRLWAGEKMMLDMPVVMGLCAYIYFLKMGDIRWIYHEGAGLWWESRFITIGEALTNIILNISLCRVWGVFGIVIATVISIIVFNFFLTPAVLFRSYFRNGRLREYYADHMQYALTMLITAAVSWWLCERAVISARPVFAAGVLQLAVDLLICTVMSIVVFCLFWGRTVRFREAKGWIMNMAGK